MPGRTNDAAVAAVQSAAILPTKDKSLSRRVYERISPDAQVSVRYGCPAQLPLYAEHVFFLATRANMWASASPTQP